MKKFILLACLISGFVRGAQTAGNSGTTRVVTPVPPSGQNLAPGQQPLRNQSPISSQTGANLIVSSNQIGTAANQLQGSNSLVSIGAASNSNELNSNFILRDEAVTDSDKAMLITLRQNVQTLLGVTSPEAMPVHFSINNGVVTVAGTVAAPRAFLRILLLARQTPGVTGIINNLHIGNPPANVQPETNFAGAATDHTLPTADQALLTAVSGNAAAQSGIGRSPTARLPVELSIENAVVSVTGQVSSMREKQALLSAIQNTPGVVRVVDDVQVTGRVSAGITTTSSNAVGHVNPFVNSNWPPTWRHGNGSNSLFLNTTNPPNMMR